MKARTTLLPRAFPSVSSRLISSHLIATEQEGKAPKLGRPVVGVREQFSALPFPLSSLFYPHPFWS